MAWLQNLWQWSNKDWHQNSSDSSARAGLAVASIYKLKLWPGPGLLVCDVACNVRNIQTAVHWLGQPPLFSEDLYQLRGGDVWLHTFHCAYRVASCSLQSGPSWSSLVGVNPIGFDIWNVKQTKNLETDSSPSGAHDTVLSDSCWDTEIHRNGKKKANLFLALRFYILVHYTFFFFFKNKII